MSDETEPKPVVQPEKAVTIKAESVVTVAPPIPATVPAPLAGRPEDKLPSATTPEQDRTTASQRRINILWEVTQAVIAVGVTLSTVYVASTLSIRGDGGTAAFLLLSNSFFLIIGFYFSRTNHSNTGGVGSKEGKER